MKMKLSELVTRLHKPLVAGSLDVDVASVTADSRQVEAGSVFVAIRGTQVDGRRFIGQAAEAGAVAVICETAPETGDPAEVTWIQVADARAALSSFAAGLAGDPSQKLRMIGVTGTNGKTTTGFLCHHLMVSQWHRAGLLGTVLVDDGELDEVSFVRAPVDATHGLDQASKHQPPILRFLPREPSTNQPSPMHVQRGDPSADASRTLRTPSPPIKARADRPPSIRGAT